MFFSSVFTAIAVVLQCPAHLLTTPPSSGTIKENQEIFIQYFYSREKFNKVFAYFWGASGVFFCPLAGHVLQRSLDLCNLSSAFISNLSHWSLLCGLSWNLLKTGLSDTHTHTGYIVGVVLPHLFCEIFRATFCRFFWSIFPAFSNWKKGKDPHPQDKSQQLDFTKDPRPLYYKTPPCVLYHKNVRSKAVFGP